MENKVKGVKTIAGIEKLYAESIRPDGPGYPIFKVKGKTTSGSVYILAAGAFVDTVNAEDVYYCLYTPLEWYYKTYPSAYVEEPDWDPITDITGFQPEDLIFTGRFKR